MEVPPQWHSVFWAGVDRNLHPRVVFRVELSNIVQRPMGQGVPTEHPERSTTIRIQRVTKAG